MDLTDQNAPDALADAIVVYAHGARKRLGTFWATQPALLIFLRHFACPGCWEQAAELTPHLSALKAAGIRVVLVGLAEPSRILPFRDRARLEDADVDIVVDASLATHRAAGLLRSAWATYGPRSVASALKLYASGYYIPRDEDDGDLLQQGGALLIDRSGRIVLHHVAKHPTDHVDLRAVVKTAEGVAARPTLRL
ncbi:MAG TPA: peroxiredoxin-like family protein [Polyangiaceae bacterium]|nr:peroxiredoxin-like family protein [Polyangiaceae bacterium]